MQRGRGAPQLALTSRVSLGGRSPGVRPSVRPPLHRLDTAGEVWCHLPANFSRLFCRGGYSPQVQLIFYPGSSLPCGTRPSNLRGLRVLKEGESGREESGVLRANPRSSVLESHSSPGEHRATLHIALASPAAAGSTGEPAASQPSRCASPPALLSSPEINLWFLAWARWQQGSSVGVPHPLGGSWPDMAGAGRSPAAFLALIWGWGLVCRRCCCKCAQLFHEPMKYLT